MTRPKFAPALTTQMGNRGFVAGSLPNFPHGTAQVFQPSSRLGSPSSLAIALRVARTVSASS